VSLPNVSQNATETHCCRVFLPLIIPARKRENFTQSVYEAQQLVASGGTDSGFKLWIQSQQKQT
jgi:hypothetical protein